MSSPTSEPWIAPTEAEIVWFSGADSTRFLDDLISQRIADMEEGETRRSFLLSPQGKLDHIFWVIRLGERHGLLCEDGRGADLAAALARYQIRVSVDVEQEEGDVWLVVGPWEGPDVSWSTVERHVGTGERPPLRQGTPEEYDLLRVSSGEPRWGVDVDEGTIPHESGLVPISVDFDKGCYLGQELVARIDSRGGNVPRRLRRVESGDGALQAGVELTKDGRAIGTITSAVGPLGLALVRREIEVGETVDAGGIEVRVRDLPSR